MYQSPISCATERGYEIVGAYGYARGMTPGGYTALRLYIRVEYQVAERLYMVSHLHLADEIMISRSVISLDDIRECQLFRTFEALHSNQEQHFDRLYGPRIRAHSEWCELMRLN